MGSPQPFIRGVLATAAASALTLSAVALASPAKADTASPTPVSASLPTAQVNGVVWAQAIANGVDYVGGSFDQSQPAGAAAGADVTTRSNLFAFDVDSGAALPGFSAQTNGQVRSIAASADGSRIYIAGDFTSVNGQFHNHIAALDPSGNVVAGFAPNVNSNVYAVTTRGDTVWFAGSFSAVDGQTRSRAAAVSTSGTVLPFAPSVGDNVVRAIALGPDSKRILLGGNFTTTNGAGARGLAAVDSITGASQPWFANSVVYDSGANSSIYSLSTRGTVVYATGYLYGDLSDGNLEGAIAMNWADGTVAWIEDCHGDSYSSYPFNDAVYVASHAHDCSNVVGGWSSPGTPSQWRRAQAFSQAAVGTLAHNTEPGYFDFGGNPSPTLVAGWSPSINTGTYTGTNQGAWSVTGGGSYVVYGGEFTKVDGARQTGLVRFQGQPEAPDSSVVSSAPTPTPTPTETPTPTPTVTATDPTAPPVAPGPPVSGITPHQVSKPDAVALGPSQIAVRWSAPSKASDDHVTGYVVRTYKGSAVVRTVTVAATKRLAVIGGLTKSTTYRVIVAAKNAAGIGKVSTADSAKTTAKGKNVSATKLPSKVVKPTASVGTAKVRVRWKAASTASALAVVKYEVRVVLSGKTVRTYTVDDRVRSKLVTSLKRHAAYTVAVRAGSWAGWSAWSSSRSVQTR